MKKTITLIFFAFMAVGITNAQDTIRSLKVGEWEKTLETNIIYTVEPYGNSIEIKEGAINLHSFTMPNSLIYSIEIDPTTDEGVIINGIKWATRNLASHGKFVEKPEDYGALFQWGRKGDGHEQRTSPNYPTNDNSEEDGTVSDSGLDANGQIASSHAAYGKFIKQVVSPYNWRSPLLNTLWNSGTGTAPVKTVNDPCPVGWRVPTQTELQSLQDSGSEWDELNGVTGRYFGDGANKLFLPAAGCRDRKGGGVFDAGLRGYYWSSTVSNFGARFLYSYEGVVTVELGQFRAYGHSVRCVADL